ncbi:DUF3775 domain-containing protein [Pseudoruegeria sp. HB172150]|uniref:DUF3775 domain-containing protein n=1 Tax=Pseudoruegeria sp. HB172150 TaxID=2721164 RepID=UPI001551B381|nr:DUF3775 domain-containing protein [Pseudoruegeria sp. HB172150]
MPQISPRRVAHVIVRAREIDAKVGRWDSPGDSADAETILEARRGDATEAELREFIAKLPEDEQAELVAIMWIGRETFDAEEWDEAVETAVNERTSPTEDYLLGIPHLADYLESGLEKLDVDVSGIEEDFL